MASYEKDTASWNEYRADAPGFGFTRSAYWLAIEIKNHAASLAG